MVKIVCISDTHCQLSQVKIPDGDILIHCGDWTMMGEQKEIMAFGRHLRKLPHKYKIIIPGNHDLTFDPNHDKYHLDRLKWLKKDDSIHILMNEYITILGIKFYGTSRVPPIGNPIRRWAFETSLARRKEIYDSIIYPIDILVSHSPPSGILDEYSHYGCEALLAMVKRIKPKYHIFGHCHGGYGEKEIDGIKFINASTCNLSYYPVNKPIVIEI